MLCLVQDLVEAIYVSPCIAPSVSLQELALLHHSRRTATVVSHGVVELLAIGRDDFFDIFMSGQGPDDIPDHVHFAGQLDFMKDWPIQTLLERPECCLFHFFKYVNHRDLEHV